MTKKPTLGALAPSVALLDEEGREWRLESMRGRAVLLIFLRHLA